MQFLVQAKKRTDPHFLLFLFKSSITDAVQPYSTLQ